MTRTLTAAAVALALVTAGCGSNNAGKIVGRWRAEKVDLPIGPVGPQDLVWEFGEDGAFTISWVNQGNGAVDTKVRGRYTLGLADTVKLTDLNPPLDGKTRAAEKVVIDGDTMIVGGAGKDQTYRFTRLPPR